MHIVTKARGGEQFLEEWLRFHLALGVGKVWLYEDGDSAAMGRIARSFGERVLHIPQPVQEGKGGNAALLDTLRDWPTRCAASRDCPSWIFYTDPDEFLNLRGYSSILNFLDQFDRFRVGAVCLPRYDFGTSGLRTAVDGSVLQSFVHRMPVPVAPKCISSTALLRALTTHTQHAWRTQRAHRHARTPTRARIHTNARDMTARMETPLSPLNSGAPCSPHRPQYLRQDSLPSGLGQRRRLWPDEGRPVVVSHPERRRAVHTSLRQPWGCRLPSARRPAHPI